jgi:FMN reductase
MANTSANLRSGATAVTAARLKQAARASQRGGGPIMVIGGSLRGPSASRAAAQYIEGEIAQSGVATSLFTVDELNLPPFNPDYHRVDRSVAEDFIDAVRRCRAMIWCAPAYHQTISGSFKNVVDFIELTADDESVYLTGKAVGLVSTSGGFQAAVNCITSMQFAVYALRAFVLPYSVPIPFGNSLLDENGRIKDENVLRKLQLLAEEVRLFLGNYKETSGRATNALKHLE